MPGSRNRYPIRRSSRASESPIGTSTPAGTCSRCSAMIVRASSAASGGTATLMSMSPWALNGNTEGVGPSAAEAIDSMPCVSSRPRTTLASMSE
jgi:hypothetical protein